LRGVKNAPPIVARYLALAEEKDRRYPGSPLFARAVLDRADDRFSLYELEDATRWDLERVASDERTTIEGGDGLAGMRESLDARSCVLIDPPYHFKQEWERVPDALASAHQREARARFMLWYPIKSYARPNAMHARLEKYGLSFTALELLTSPIGSRKNRLNGSGLLFVNAPAGLIEELAALAAWLGPHLALPIPPHAAYWTTRAVGIGVSVPSS
jgi:23S rRNA A2030 N6-methylase RlmJ